MACVVDEHRPSRREVFYGSYHPEWFEWVTTGNFRSTGKALILSHEKFNDSKLNRDGNQWDVEKLQRTYTQLGLEVMLYEDKTTNDIQNILKGMKCDNEQDVVVYATPSPPPHSINNLLNLSNKYTI